MKNLTSISQILGQHHIFILVVLFGFWGAGALCHQPLPSLAKGHLYLLWDQFHSHHKLVLGGNSH